MNEKEPKKRRIFCPKCGKPIAEVAGKSIYFLERSGGKTAKIKMTVEHKAGGKSTITCDCGGTFSTTILALPMTYVIAPKKEDDLT